MKIRFGQCKGDTLRRRPSEAGQALVEFALIVTTLILIVVGIFEFGRAVEAYTEISNGAREGARYASVRPGWGLGSPDLDGAKAAALAKVALTGDAEVEANVSADEKVVTVTVRYGFQPAVPLIWGSGGVITLTSSSTMRVEGAPKY